jgi:hypothetical protein
MKNDGIISVTIGDKTYNVEEFETIYDGNNKMKCEFDIELKALQRKQTGAKN